MFVNLSFPFRMRVLGLLLLAAAAYGIPDKLPVRSSYEDTGAVEEFSAPAGGYSVPEPAPLYGAPAPRAQCTPRVELSVVTSVQFVPTTVFEVRTILAQTKPLVLLVLNQLYISFILTQLYDILAYNNISFSPDPHPRPAHDSVQRDHPDPVLSIHHRPS